jgi:hypothetical protein
MSSQTDYVTLISNDGFEFIVKRSCAILAGAIKNMLDPNSKNLPKPSSESEEAKSRVREKVG